MSQVLTATEFQDRGKGIDGIIDAMTGLADATSVDISFPNSGKEILFVSNESGAPITATLNAVPNAYGRGQTAHNEVRTVPAADVGMFAFMAPGMFNTGGNASVTLSTVTDVKVALYRLVHVK